MKITAMHMAKGTSKIKAYFDLELEGITVKGFKLVEGPSGLFVGVPSEKREEKWFDRVYVPKELKDGLTSVALGHYDALIAGAPESQATPQDDLAF